MEPTAGDLALSRELVPALTRQPGHLLWRAHARVLLYLAETLPPDVDIHAYAVLLVLADGEPRSQQALAETVEVSRTTTANVARGLVAQGLVERVRNPADRRSYALTRTRAGAEAVRQWRPMVQRVERALTAPLSAPEHDDLRDLLGSVAEPALAPDTPAELRNATGFLLSRVRMRMHRSFAEALEPWRLDPRLFGALTVLTSLGPASQGEVARALGLSGASVVQIADDLERLGLVERRRSSSDRRTQILHLREAAADVQRQAAVLAHQTKRTRLHPLDEAQIERLCDLLVVLIIAE